MFVCVSLNLLVSPSFGCFELFCRVIYPLVVSRYRFSFFVLLKFFLGSTFCVILCSSLAVQSFFVIDLSLFVILFHVCVVIY